MPASTNRYPFYSPRFWHGMRLGHYLRLLARHRFRVVPSRIVMAIIILGFALANSIAWRLQAWIYGRRIREFDLPRPPLFIIGHWRSGTTLLHEYLVQDQRLAFPTTYQVFAPTHFLLTQWCLPKLFWFILPRRRPMDNMATGFDRPQEDEFALCALGAPTPYERMAFPNDPPVHLDFLDMSTTDTSETRQFEEALNWFVKAVSLREGQRRLVLKSPPHTGRIATLRRLFPGAQFIHICRDPFEVVPSTLRLWPSLDQAQGFQTPRYSAEWLEDFVFDCGERMYRGYDQQVRELPPEDLLEVRYEDLVADPLGTLETIYERFDLGPIAEAREAFAAFHESQASYRRNQHRVAPDLAARIHARWQFYFERFGYPGPEATPAGKDPAGDDPASV